MKQHAKFSQKQEQIVAQESQQTAREFASSDELLRYDAARVVLPPEIAERLQKSAAETPEPSKRRWWRQLFGGG